MSGKKGSYSYTMSNEHRDKIKNSNILSRLIAHAEGDLEMTQSQVTTGLGLLKKVLPDLQSVTVGGDDQNPVRLTIGWQNPSTS